MLKKNPASSHLQLLCMHLFNHRSVLKLLRYPACFGTAVEIGGFDAAVILPSQDELAKDTGQVFHPNFKFRNPSRLLLDSPLCSA